MAQPWGPRTELHYAIRRGDLAGAQRAHTEGHALDAQAWVTAARIGSLDILKWLHATGCPLDEEALAYTKASGSREIHEWALTNGLPQGKCTCIPEWVKGRFHDIYRNHQLGCRCDLSAFNPSRPEVVFLREYAEPIAPTWEHHTAVQWLHGKGAHLVPWAQQWLAAVREELTAHILPDVAAHIVEKYI